MTRPCSLATPGFFMPMIATPQSMHFAEPLPLQSGAVLRDYMLAF